MANWIKLITNKIWFKDSEQEVDLDSLVKGENTTFSDCPFTINEDDMASDSDVFLPTQQSVKAYIATQIAAVSTSNWGSL